MQDQPLAKLDLARHALAECKTAMEAKQISDVAEAARVYLERTNASAETVNQATEIRLLAERQMGAFLKNMPKSTGAMGIGPNAVAEKDRIGGLTTLAEIGISKDQSVRSQKLAEISEPEFKERIALVKAGGEKLSTSKVLNLGIRRSPAAFNLKAWQSQSRSIMATWLRNVPPEQLDHCVTFLSNLPHQILPQIK